MKVIFLLFALTLLASCHNVTTVGNDYYYLPDHEAMDIGYPNGSIVYKSSAKNSFEKILVYSAIEKCISNDEYIIVLQKPNKQNMRNLIKEDFNFWNQYLQDFQFPELSFCVDFYKKNNFTQICDNLIC